MKTALLLCVFALLASEAKAASVICYNKNLAKSGLSLALSRRSDNYYEGQAKYETSACMFGPMDYKPNSSKYEGWIRVGSPKDNCAGLGKAMLGISSLSQKPMKIYWISVSKEVQAGQNGFIQLGYQNDGDPGAGGVMKAFMSCYAH